MVSDLDIYRSARLMIRQHGAGAGIEANNLVEHFTAQGDQAGANVWWRIGRAIEDLGPDNKGATQWNIL